MSPWSRPYSFRPVFAAALLAAVLTVLAGAGPAGAQEQPLVAVLLSGPTPVKGIPVYAPNRIPAFQGVYALKEDLGADQAAQEEPSEGAEALQLRVLYSRQDLLVPGEWTARRCGTRQLFQVPEYETFALCYHSEQGFYLFFLFPETEEPGYWCAFVDSLIERFLFLLNFVNSDTGIPFPAILQLDLG